MMNNAKKSIPENEITNFFSWISGQIQKNNILFLRELHQNQKTLGLNFQENEILFAIIELNMIGYVYHDFALFTENYHEYRNKFNTVFYEDNKKLFLQLNYNFTANYFNQLINDIGLLLKNEDIETISSRILFTLNNNIPVDKQKLLFKTNGLQTIIFTPLITKHLVECMKHAKHFVNSLQEK